jgi:hypothetical protein
LSIYKKTKLDVAMREITYKTVCILESVSKEDERVNRNEAHELSKILSSIGYKVIMYKPRNIDELWENLMEFADWHNHYNSEQILVPFIHISAHGNEKGIELTEDGLVLWSELREILDSFNGSIGGEEGVSGYIKNDNGIITSRITICLSACLGAYGSNMIMKNEITPFQYLIAPNYSPYWEDALRAYRIFYEKCFSFNGGRIWDAVHPMNDAKSGKNTFEIFQSPEVADDLNERKSK